MSFESAETMLDKAIDLLAGAQALHGDGNDHAAILVAIHSGINSADAINEFYGEPFSGEHRKASDHLRQWDPERLSDGARRLRHLIDMKATAAYRQKRYTAHNTVDAEQQLHIWSGSPIPRSNRRSTLRHACSEIRRSHEFDDDKTLGQRAAIVAQMRVAVI